MEQTSETGDAVAIVQAWHDALNAGDAARLGALVHDDVELGGPRGTARGAAMVREWAERAGVRMAPVQIVQRGNVVVVEQHAQWRSEENGDFGDPQIVATLFVVRDGKVSRLIRFADLDTALAAADDAAGGAT